MDFTKLDQVADYMIKEKVVGISNKKQENNSGFAERTVVKYKYELHTMYNYMENHWGITDYTKVKKADYYRYYDERIQEYHQGNTGMSSHLRALDDAMFAINTYAVQSGEFAYKLKFPKKESLSKKVTDSGVKRHAKDSSVKAASRREVKAVCDYLRNEVNTQASNVAADALWGEYVSGRRISAQLRHKAGNYNENKGSLTSYGDKGGKNNIGYLSQEAKEHYSKLAHKEDGTKKSAGAPMLTIKYTHKDRAGEDKSIEEMRKQCSKLYKKASEELIKRGVLKNTVSSHSARKGFAQATGESLIRQTKPQLQKQLDSLTANDPKLKGKVNNVMKNILSKFTNEENKKKREENGFTKKELVTLISSIAINHSRTDVMRYYLDKEFWERMNAKYPNRI